MECGHGGICYECGKRMISSDYSGGACHLCREQICYILQMDLSTVYSDFIKVISATFVDDASENTSEDPNSETG